MAVGHGAQVEAQLSEYAFNRAAEFLRVLQGAGAVERQSQIAAHAKCAQRLVAQHFHQVPGQRTDPGCFFGIGRVAAEQVAVVLDKGTAAAGGLHDRFGPLGNPRPPGIDIASGAIKAGGLGVQMIIHGTAAPGLRRRDYADTQAVEHAGRGCVGVG